MSTFPIYILGLGDMTKVVFPATRKDIGHVTFWETTVSHLVARHFSIPQARLYNLPYCQRRARIAESNQVFYGEQPDPDLLQLIRQTLGNNHLTFCHDGHEKRLREDVCQFRKLLRRFAST